MDILQERWELAVQRIKEISPETMGIYADYIKLCQTLFNGVEQVINEPHTPQNLRKWNELFYRDIKGEQYTSSMADPAYMNQVFGQKIGSYLCLYYVNFRNAVTAAYEGKLQPIIWQAELFLQLYGILSEEGSGISERSLKETFYYHIHDYDEERMEESMEQMLLPKKSSYLMQLIMDRDHKCLDYLYEYGEYITETEEKRSDFAVTSEISGKVIMVGVKAGEKPRQSGQTAVSVYNLDSMTISANIDELDIDQIEMGMEVAITQSGAESDTNYTGTVTEISYEATNSNGVAYFPITITIPSEGALSAGVNVSYIITVGDESEGVLAPISALKSTSEGTCLFVKADSRPDNAVDLEDGTVPDGFYAVPVETGVSNSQYVRILSGVEEGTEVFTRYQTSAPSGGESTSQGQGGDAEFSFPGGDFGGGMPNFGGGGGGGMPGGMGPMG